MDERDKAKILLFGFVVFVLIAAFAISTTRDKITGGVIVEGCKIECNSNEDCDDGDYNTLDGCVYPGSCASKCFHESE